jgi:ribosomal protein L29
LTYTEKFTDLKELKMYQNQIREMTETELREFVKDNKLTLRDLEGTSKNTLPIPKF